MNTIINTSADSLGLITITLRPSLLLKVIQLLTSSILFPQNISLEPPRKSLRELIFGVCSGGYSKDVIQFFESSLFSLWQEQEDKKQGNDIHPSIKSECTLDAESSKLAREGDGDDGGPEIVCGDGPGHSYLTMGEGEDFCRVGEGDGSFTGRIECVVDVDEEGHEAEMCSA